MTQSERGLTKLYNLINDKACVKHCWKFLECCVCILENTIFKVIIYENLMKSVKHGKFPKHNTEYIQKQAFCISSKYIWKCKFPFKSLSNYKVFSGVHNRKFNKTLEALEVLYIIYMYFTQVYNIYIEFIYTDEKICSIINLRSYKYLRHFFQL